VHSNAAWVNGGAALIEGANLIADRCTIVSNTNNGYNRIGGISGAGNCNIQIKNSILWNNSTNQYGSFSSGPGGNATFTFSYSIVQGGTTATVGGNTKTLVNTGTGCLTSDPVFAETTSYTLGTGSPAINTGDPAAAKDADGSRADIGWDAAATTGAGSDTDGDGVSDYREVQDGTNPNDSTSFNQLSKGLVAYYPFNGNTKDESGSGNNVVLQGPTLSADMQGNSNKALLLPTSSSYAESSNPIGVFGGSHRTVSFWIYIPSLIPYADIIGWGNLKNPTSNGSTFQLDIVSANGGGIYAWGHYADNYTSNIGNFLKEKWNQITYVYSGSVNSAKFYLNGYLLSSSQLNTQVFSDVYNTPNTTLRIGDRGDGRNLSFPGTILDDIRIYNRALSAAEVTQLYSQESGEPNTVLVQGGTLPAGSALAGQTVSAFQIARFETTWAEWKAVRAWAVANGYTDLANVGEGSADNHPVRNVSWYDAAKWLNAKSQMEGFMPVYSVNGTTYKAGQSIPAQSTSANGYRLPSEKEWEWAARGGESSQNYTYSGSNDINLVGWYSLNAAGGTKVVGSKDANEIGLYDMSGNLAEWCFDATSSLTSERSVRGGSFYYDEIYSRSAYRGRINADYRGIDYGLRYARNAIGDMVTVQGGTLPAGSTLAGQQVQTFDIGRTEVTWGEWKEVREWALLNGYSDLASVGQGSADNHPVRNVNWYDAVKWSNAKSQMEGSTPVYQMSGAVYKTGDTAFPTISSTANGYRLPTETEWEWAARGGVNSQGYIFSGSNDLDAVAWFRDNSGGGPQPVGQKQPNELGIYDMTGNIYEWSWNANGIFRGLEGGSYGESSTDILCRVAYRGQDQVPSLRSLNLGLRLARNSGN